MKIIKSATYIIGLFASCFMLLNCEKEPEIEYAPGYPTIMAGNWIVFQTGINDTITQQANVYELVTSLDPNRKDTLILDNIEEKKIRIRAKLDTAFTFSSRKAEQINPFYKETFPVTHVTLDGQVSSDNLSVRSAVYQLALGAFPNMRFGEDDISETIVVYVGTYTADGAIKDSTRLIGYRKTGFEEVDF